MFSLRTCFPCYLQLRNEILFVFCDAFLDFFPNLGAIAIFQTYDSANELVDVFSVVFRDFYSCFLEDFLQTSEITCQIMSHFIIRFFLWLIGVASETVLFPCTVFLNSGFEF